MDCHTVWDRRSIQNITWYCPLPSEIQAKGWQKVTYKKNEQEGIEFVSNFGTTLNYIASSIPFDGNIKVFSQDESRIGLLPIQRRIQRRRITLRVIKPISHVQQEFKSYYLYGSVEPLTGENFFLELPALDTACFQVYIDELSKAYKDSFNILILDRGSFHKSNSLRLPSNVAFILLPPYSPELNPIERVLFFRWSAERQWESVKDEIANEIYPDIDSLKNRVASVLSDYADSTFSSLTSYPYLINAVNDVFQ